MSKGLENQISFISALYEFNFILYCCQSPLEWFSVSLFCFRLESGFRSFSRPMLHAAARVVQEMGKSRAAAFAVGLQDIDEGDYVNTFSEMDSADPDANDSSHSEGKACLTILMFPSIPPFHMAHPKWDN